jgi:hypothetical protein
MRSRRAAARRLRSVPYLVPDDEDDEVEPDGEPDVVVSLGVLGAADGAGGGGVTAVGGDAEGVRSAGRSPTRSVCDSVQAVASVATSARAVMPSSVLFISVHLLRCATGAGKCKAGATERRKAGVRRMQAQARRDGGPHA